ncbi:hypothetical protein SCLCIDRAFT_1113028 [Scleroderma citrinum Foug A]|uniref:Uncharacterized protein n=1 Tax=Scleroderma citrinum Foug A TaxID=1036808 RepID=A0A0C3ART4_9AGAM|nr:hypothetical protein SCLCIDRAFT_1113028 [Scleroderma citrinum Foug A]
MIDVGSCTATAKHQTYMSIWTAVTPERASSRKSLQCMGGLHAIMPISFLVMGQSSIRTSKTSVWNITLFSVLSFLTIRPIVNNKKKFLRIERTEAQTCWGYHCTKRATKGV